MRQDSEKFELPKRNTKNKHSENQYIKNSFASEHRKNVKKLLGQDGNFATRHDQLNLRPPKEKGTKGKGRGRGKGKGRGGRGGRGTPKQGDDNGKKNEKSTKQKLKEDYSSGPDWTEEMQEAWDAWTYEEENKWDEYVKTESAASVAAIKKKKGTEEETDEKAKKKKRKTEVVSTEGEKDETPEKKKKIEKGGENTSVEVSPSDRQPFPHKYKAQVATILDFLNKIETFDIPDPRSISSKTKDLIRCHIPNSAEARLTVYWKRPAVGVYMRSESRDIACFSFGAMADNHPFLLRLAASLKIGSLMVTCRTHLSMCM